MFKPFEVTDQCKTWLAAAIAYDLFELGQRVRVTVTSIEQLDGRTDLFLATFHDEEKERVVLISGSYQNDTFAPLTFVTYDIHR